MNLTVSNYSEKSFVVRGDTKSHKDVLKEIGGKYNPNLRDGAGWIFSMNKRESVEKYIKKTENIDSGNVWIFIETNKDGTFLRGVFSSYEKAEKVSNKYRDVYADWYEECGFNHQIIEISIDIQNSEKEKKIYTKC